MEEESKHGEERLESDDTCSALDLPRRQAQASMRKRAAQLRLKRLATESEEVRRIRKKKEADYKKAWRNAQTEEEKSERKRQDRERKRKAREARAVVHSTEPSPQNLRRQRNTDSVRERRKTESEEQKRNRLQLQQERQALSRQAESFEQKAKRLREDASRQQIRREEANRDCREIDETLNLTPVSAARQKEVLNKLRLSLGAPGMDETVCAVCDRLSISSGTHRYYEEDIEFLKRLDKCLKPPDAGLPCLLVKQYDCSPLDIRLGGLMLSPRGVHRIHRNGSETFVLITCNECNMALKTSPNVQGQYLPPKFAIANHFFVGELPDELYKATWAEQLMTQLVTVVARTRVMRGGRHRAIRSHCMVFHSSCGPPAANLPRKLDEECMYRVILAGEITDTQKHQIRKLHEVRHCVVQKLLAFFSENNYLYSNVCVDENALRRLESNPEEFVPDRIYVQEVNVASDIVDEVENEQDSVRGRSDAVSTDTEEEETTVIERNVLFLPEDIPGDGSIEQHALQHHVPGFQNNPEFRIHHSSRFAPEDNGLADAKMHAHLFPFGRGHPAEIRRVPVSRKECVKYYGLLSLRRFAQDQTYILTAFDRLAMQNMYMQTSILCKRYPQLYDGFESITANQLARALIDNEQTRRGQASSIPSQSIEESVTKRFLKSVEVGTSSVWGTNTERKMCRREAFGYQTRYGQPALFVTITPDADNSYTMAYYAGGVVLETLFDADPAKLPSRVEMKKIAMGDNVASARLFDRMVNAFIEDVLAYDRGKRVSKKGGGLFGFVKAYFGMIETQGGGALHGHFLIWLHGAPQNSFQYAEVVSDKSRSPDFPEQIIQYTDSIVQTSLPLTLSSLPCANCKIESAGMVSLPIPLAARQDPMRKSTRRGPRMEMREPALAGCVICGNLCSSQHLIRSILLAHRPSQWPPALARLQDETDFIQRVQLQTQSRYTVDKYQIRERILQVDRNCNSFQDYLNNGGGNTVYEDLRKCREELINSNECQNKYTRCDDDPLRRDTLFRMMAMMPPSLDDSRMSTEDSNCMVTYLVTMMNMHWWAHTASCFKKDKECRYSFPRECAPKTALKRSAIELQRAVGHEYINGFNKTIMETFKCNHDIQVLIGGEDATGRIYYACKYVAKPQNNVECSAALALAAFARRQEKERIQRLERDDSTAPAIARRRVSSMVYTMTNQQEIAGPMAALYILKGSCCYQSDTTAKLSLSQAIKYLTTSEPLMCSLVNVESTENDSSDRYAATSKIDDYIYRPEEFEELSLYEYTMKCSRKRCSSNSPEELEDARKFKRGHPLHTTHAVQVHRYPVIPVIIGPRLPLCYPESDTKAKEKHGQIALILFKAFRNRSDLVEDADYLAASDTTASAVSGLWNRSIEEETAYMPRLCWSNAYNKWKSSRSPFIVNTMNNMYDYFTGRQKAIQDGANFEAHAKDTTEGDNSEDDGYQEEDDECTYDIGDTQNTYDDETCTGDEDYECFTEYEIVPAGSETDKLDPRRFPGSAPITETAKRVISEFRVHSLVEKMAASTAESYEERRNTSETTTSFDGYNDHRAYPVQNVQALREWVQSNTTDNQDIESTLSADELQILEIQNHDLRVVELLDEALQPENLKWAPSQIPKDFCTRSSIPRHSNLKIISQVFTLNHLQHVAFVAVGRSMIKRWRRKYQDAGSGEEYTTDMAQMDRQLEKEQLLMFLGGEGGTGKSRVIEAIEALCESWDHSRALVKAAWTGKAATLIRGKTVSSFMLWLENAGSSEMVEWLDLLIIDEISMLGQLSFYELDNLLRKKKRISNVPFGGVHIVLAGDFLQLPPVAAQALFENPDMERKTPRHLIKRRAAFQVYMKFSCVVVLKESMRFKDDQQWGEGCAKARRGIWTEEFIDIINSRHLFADPRHLTSEPGMIADYQQLQNTLGPETRFVTPDNLTRTAINNYFMSETSLRLPQGAHPIRIVASFNKDLKDISDKDVQRLMDSPDSTFGRLAPFLDLVPGMKVQVTQNLRNSKGVANGTMATLIDIIFPESTTFQLIKDSGTGMSIYYPNKKPLYALIKVERGEKAKPMPGFPKEIFPVFPDCQSFSPTTFFLTPSRDGSKRPISLSIKQFPFVNAAGSTIYKVQGETLKSIVIVDWKMGKVDKPQQVYLMVSRAVTRNAFLTMSPLTSDIVEWAKPPRKYLAEEDRLLRASEVTVAELLQSFKR